MKIEIEKNVDISPEDFYDYMIEQVRLNLCEQNEKEIPASEIKEGYTQTRHVVNPKTKEKRFNRFTIQRARRGEEYKSVLTSEAQKTVVCYLFEPTDKGCKFTFIQDISWKDPSKAPKSFGSSFNQMHLRSQYNGVVNKAVKECKKHLKQREKESHS